MNFVVNESLPTRSWTSTLIGAGSAFLTALSIPYLNNRCGSHRSAFIALLLLGSFLATSSPVLAQEDRTGLRSDIDELLTVHTLSLMPFVDNVQSIYSRPLEAHLNDRLLKMHRFDFVPLSQVGPIATPDELASDPKLLETVKAQISADAFLVCKITKGPQGVSIRMNLYLKNDTGVLIDDESKDLKISDIPSLKSELDRVFDRVIAKLPFQGLVLSRDQTRLTVNLGRLDGIEKDQIAPVVQIISAKRHPKFRFLISTEKEIVGRVRFVKVEDTLSFATILSERERGTISKGSKISVQDFVNYPQGEGSWGNSDPKLLQGPDKQIFGDHPKEWLPTRPPSFGRVGGGIGFGQYAGKAQVSSESLEGSNNFYPLVQLDGELWITSTWQFSAALKQAIVGIDNPRNGSTPSQLNQAMSQYELLFGYAMRMAGHVWGPSIVPQLGWFNSRTYIDDSTPRSFTTSEYSGLKVGGWGYFPLGPDRQWHAGLRFYFHWRPKLKESPKTSGEKSTNAINEFGVFAAKRLGERLQIIGRLDLQQFSSSFSGTGTRAEPVTNFSQKFLTLTGGVNYYF